MKGTTLPYQYASPQPTGPAETAWRGYIDSWDPLTGILGWALSSESPSESLKLELVIGDVALTAAETNRPRRDLSDLLGVSVAAGFHFGPEIFPRLARLKRQRADHAVYIRVAGTNVRLPGRMPVSTVAALVEQWHAALLTPAPSLPDLTSRADKLRFRLALLRRESEPFTNLPLRPVAENESGHVDALYLDNQSLLWFTGWIARDFDMEFSAIVSDRQKYPAGVATLQYERQDLASRFVGIIGLIDTAWAPPALTGDLFIYAGENMTRQLRVSARTKLMGAEAFLLAYRQAETLARGANVTAMSALLAASDQWIPGGTPTPGGGGEASVDRLFVIAGFGCIAEGWSVMPGGRVKSIELKIGDNFLLSDEDATYFRSRPDLATVAGDEVNLSCAGFVTVLRGEVPTGISGVSLLRILFEDGSALVRRLEAKRFRQLDCVADSAQILRLYPSLRQERCYPALCAAIERQLARRAHVPQTIALSPSERLVVLTLPGDLSNLRLCFDYIAQLRSLAHMGVGICLVARRSVNLAQARLLFDEFNAHEAIPLSLVCVEGQFDGFAALPFILSKHGADRFVYIDAGLMLTHAGWRKAIANLNRYGHAIRFFEIVDDAGLPDRIHGSLSAACFQWSTAAFLQWSVSAHCFVRGVFERNGLPLPVTDGDLLVGAAMRLESAPHSRLADMIDADVLSGRQSFLAHA